MTETQLYSGKELRDYAVRFLAHFEVPDADARVMADVLVSADERGIDSHGIIRLNSYYGTRLRRGLIDPSSPTRVVKETPATLVLDGGNGLGPVVAHRAMLRCIDKVKETALAAVTVRNSNHFGIAGYYAMMALPHDLIGVSLTNSQPLVAPTYSRAALLGTNPISVAIPAGRERPYVLDMATSIVSIGRITVCSKNQESIPQEWGLNSAGDMTTDPNAVLDHGALLPLGGPDILRGYKGYGLGLLVDMLCGVLSGAAFGADVGRPGDVKLANVGHFFLALRISAFRSLASFREDMDQMIRQMKDAPKASGQDRVYIHGEKEFEFAERCAVSGVPVSQPIVNSLTSIGQEIGVPFDLAPIGAQSA